MEAELALAASTVFLGATLASSVYRELRRRDPVSLSYSTASTLLLVLLFHVTRAVARGRRQWLRAAAVALCVALTGLVQLKFYIPALPLSMALATWAVSASCLSGFFLVGTARPQVAR